MCGIAGIVHVDGAPYVDAGVVARMTRAMTHRGPDQEGFYLDRLAGLGSR